MTQKELLYLEDATNHEKSLISIIGETINNLQDEKLIDFMKQEQEKHNDIKERLLNILEVKASE